jgi:hypothetical protein
MESTLGVLFAVMNNVINGAYGTVSLPIFKALAKATNTHLNNARRTHKLGDGKLSMVGTVSVSLSSLSIWMLSLDI